MKKAIFLLFVLSSVACYSQQKFYGEGFTPFVYNPASYGTWNLLSVNTAVSFHDRVDFNQNATYMLSAAAKLQLVRNSKTFIPLGFTGGVNFIQQRDAWHSIQEVSFPIGIPMNLGDVYLNASVAPGFHSVEMEQDPFPLLPPGYTAWKSTKFDADIGLMLYNKSFYFGAGLTNALQPRHEKMNDYVIARIASAQAGYRIPIRNHFIFPMLQYQNANTSFHNLDAQCYFVFKDDLFSVGGGYEMNNGFSIGASFQYKGFRLAANTAFHLNKLTNANRKTFEFRLSYLIKDKRL
jgi:hypothetical protein